VSFSKAIGKENIIYINKMTKINSNFSMKCIVTDSTDNLNCCAYCEYKYLDKNFMESVPFYVFNGSRTTKKKSWYKKNKHHKTFFV